MMTAILYPFMSAVAHGFSALSHRARAVLFFMDYAAINFYAYGSALLYRSYVLPDTWMENETGTNIYLTVCFILSLASTALTCTSRRPTSHAIGRFHFALHLGLNSAFCTARQLFRL
jgi:predicted membrane channel-forming protein YqfA (hemolysin III family)